MGLIRPLKDPIAREGLKDLNNLERHINYWSNYKTALIFFFGGGASEVSRWTLTAIVSVKAILQVN